MHARTPLSSAGAKRSRARRSLPRATSTCPWIARDAKLRYRSEAVPARIHLHEGGFRLELDQPAYGVAPGQAAVLYEDDVVVGAGLIQADP